MNVSLVVPTFNNEKTIKLCLDSLKQQLSKNDEIIIVDSFSKDKTVEICKDYTKNIIFTKKKRSGARNIGWKKAKNEVIIFIESDSIYDKKYIYIVKELMKNEDISCVLDKRAFYKPDNWVSKTLQKEFELRQNNNYNNSPPNPWIIKKEILKKVNGFDENLEYGEDADIGIRIKEKEYKIYFEKKAIQYHLGEPNNLKQVIERSWKFGKNMEKFYNKYQKYPTTKSLIFVFSIIFPPLFLAIFLINITRYNLKMKDRIKLSFISLIRNISFSISYFLNY